MRAIRRYLPVLLLVASCGDDSAPGSDAPTLDGAQLDAPWLDGSAPGDSARLDGGADCPGGLTRCAGACVDLQTDEDHCRGCGIPCDPGEACVGGACLVGVGELVLSELHAHDPAFFELYNGSAATIELAGFVIQWAVDGGRTGSVELPAYALEAGAYVVLDGAPGSIEPGRVHLGTPIPPHSEIALRLLTPGSVGVDFLRTGASTVPPPAGTAWTGPNAATPSARVDQSLVRNVHAPDTDTAGDWSLVALGSPGAYCGRGARCGDECRDLDGDRGSCGACGLTCEASQVCVDGRCVGGAGHLWISEYRRAGPAGVELHNPTASAMDLTGYRVEIVGPTTTNHILGARTLEPGAYLFLYEGDGTDDDRSVFLGASSAFGEDAAVAVYDDEGTPLDFVRLGASAATAPAGTLWFAPNVPSPTSGHDASARRDVAVLDTDSAAEWLVDGPSTPGFSCLPGLSLCDGRCVALGEDSASCGACGRTCGAHETCLDGQCASTGALVLSELRNQGAERIEIFNGTATTLDLSGYGLAWVADGGADRYELGSIGLPPGGFLAFDEGTGDSTSTLVYMGTPIEWTEHIAVTLEDAGGSAIDFVRTGASTTLPPVGWTTGSVANPGDAGPGSIARRVYAADTDLPADWELRAEFSSGAHCVPGASTCAGACTDLGVDPASCGTCGDRCPEGSRCEGGACQIDGQLRIVGGGAFGVLEIWHEDQWRAICDDGWGQEETTVACRQLGFPHGSNWGSAAGSGAFWLDDVDCTGFETTLVACARPPWGVHDCGAYELVSVSCE